MDITISEHAQFMHELSDESLADILPVAKKVAKALNAPNYNVLQVGRTPNFPTTLVRHSSVFNHTKLSRIRTMAN